MRWYAVLFWIWALASFGMFMYRRLNGKSARPRADSPVPPTWAAGSVRGAGAGSDAASPTASDPLVSPTERSWPAPPPPDPDDDTYRAPVAAPPGPEASVASEPDAPTVFPARSTLPELLAGIALPCDLLPLTQSDPTIDLSTHILLVTRTANPREVRQGLVDELERLGYTVSHDSMVVLVATGPRGRVLVDIHPDAAGVVDAGVPRFPTAGPDSVVVELRTG